MSKHVASSFQTWQVVMALKTRPQHFPVYCSIETRQIMRTSKMVAQYTGIAVQANKAGLMEIADVFVINKADRAGAGETRRDLSAMLDLTHDPHEGHGGWRPPIIGAVATDGTGVAELWEQIGAHRDFLEQSGELGRRRGRRAREELTRIVAERLLLRARETSEGDRFDDLADRVESRGMDPWSAADELLGPDS